MKYVEKTLEEDKGALSNLDREVLESLGIVKK